MTHPVLADQIANDPDVAQVLEVGIAVAIGVVSEVWYWYAKRSGGAT